MTSVIDQAHGENWSAYCGDSAEVLHGMPDASIDLSCYSPPFGQLYAYSASERDLGNSRDDEQFFRHYGFILDELLRVTRPGRVTAVHVADVPAMLSRDGYIGLKDFSGDVIRAYIAHGWTFDGRVPIDKNQQAQSIRTHAKGLTMTQMEKDRTWSRPALPDYILKFRRPGENAVPVKGGDVDRNTWIEWANPTWPGGGDRAADGGAFATWYGISESDTLNALRKDGYAGLVESREAEDERHICPLQLGTIERIIRLWSNRGETVLTPFMGIGSEAYMALRLGRRAIGIELKRLYWQCAVRNLTLVEQDFRRVDLFSFDAESAS